MRFNLKQKLTILLTGLLLGLSSFSLSACVPNHTSLLMDYNYPSPYPYYDSYYDSYYSLSYYYPSYYPYYYPGPYYNSYYPYGYTAGHN
ncbi:MAG: hypothetical protein ACYDBV_15480 [Nitrospiria bacterium]